MKHLRSLLSLILALCLIFSLSSPAFAAEDDVESAAPSSVDIFRNVYEQYLANHLAGRDGEEVLRTTIEKMLEEHPELLESVIDGMMASGDSYSYYLTPEEVAADNATKVYGGIGVSVVINDAGEFEITSVVPSSPAQIAGIEPGDILLSVGGRSVKGLTSFAVGGLIQGEAGSLVTIGVRRGDHARFYRLNLTSLPATAVSYVDIDETTRYIKISTFSNPKAFSQFVDAIQPMIRNDDCPIKNLIFDVRDNYGGYDVLVADMLNYLVEEAGTSLFRITNKEGEVTQEYVSTGRGVKTDSITVLVNENTVSAAEVFAFCIQQLGLGTVVGTQTHGKGVGMYIFHQADGSEAMIVSLEMTAGNGASYHEVGVIPDIVVENPPLSDMPDVGALTADDLADCVYGNTNAACRALNDRLVLFGYRIETGDTFDMITRNALVSFQKKTELSPTGALDAEAIALMDELLDYYRETAIDSDLQFETALSLLHPEQ